jgi:FkbM family methyltransferase
MDATEAPAGLDQRLAGMPRWKVGMYWTLATVTPLRSRAVRERAFHVSRARARRHRRAAEARGDWSRSTPALFEMDTRLAAMLGDGGYFVEAGANDGFTQSNTYLLERRHGWRGVLVEPIPDLAREARLERPDAQVVQCALGPPEAAGRPMCMRFAGLVSIVAGSKGSEADDLAWVSGAFARGARDSYVVDVPCRTLEEILDEAQAPEVDLLSLDLEGVEPDALRGLGRHRPRWLLVEAHDAEARARIEAALGPGYVNVTRFSPLDELYRRADVEP